MTTAGAHLNPATARLDKSGLRALCGHSKNTCGGLLGSIVETPQADGTLLRLFEFPPGRTERRGAWRVTEYARRKLGRGDEPAFHKPYVRDVDGSPIEGRLEPRWPREWPTRVECPRCGGINMVTREALRVNEGWTTERRRLIESRREPGRALFVGPWYPELR